MKVSFYLARPKKEMSEDDIDRQIESALAEIRRLLSEAASADKRKTMSDIIAKVGAYRKAALDDKPTAIFARICYNGEKVKYHLADSIVPQYWNNITHRAKETKKFPEYADFNDKLDKIEAGIKNVIRKYQNDHGQEYPTPAVLKPLLDIAIKNGGKVQKLTFAEYLANFIQQCEAGTKKNPKTGKPFAAGTTKGYKTALTNLKRYEEQVGKKIGFDDITLDFYESYTEYLAKAENKDLKKRKFALNTVGKHVQTIKALMREAVELGLTKNEAYKKKAFIKMSEESQTIYLAEWELQQLAALDLADNPRLDVIRDLFLVGSYTGLRFSDLATLSKKQLSGDMMTITQIKTGNPVVIPVHHVVKNILNKYNGRMPNAISNQKTNEYLKEVCRQVKALESEVSVSITRGGKADSRTIPKWQLVSTHTARRSFATNEYLAGTPTITIRAITGHKTEKAFLKYIKVTPDEHATILQSLWKGRQEQQPKTIAI
jgi:integrase